MKKPSVLLVEDEPRYHQTIRFNLQANGYRVLSAFDGPGALRQMQAEEPDLVLLDSVLPGNDGYSVCARIRERSKVPVILLTPRAVSEYRTRGVLAGADDYLAKPFSSEELLARVTGLLRRRDWERDAQPASPQTVGDVVVESGSRRVHVRGCPVRLTPTEFRLLQALMSSRGRVMLPDDLLRKAWGPGYEGDSQLLRTAIKRLRHKIEPNPEEPVYVLNRRGVGYCFAAPLSPTLAMSGRGAVS